MPDSLQSRLHRLHDDLADVAPDTPEAHDAVTSLRLTLGQMLHHGELDLALLSARLKDSLLHLEVAHPTLAADVENVIDTLVKIGV
jgi:hypothetical protein